MNFKTLLIFTVAIFAMPVVKAGGGGGGGGGVGGNMTTVTCDVPFVFDLDGGGFVGDDPTTAAGSCGQCCFAGSDLDGDGQQDVSFSVENSQWFEWCNPTGSPITVTVGFDEPGNGGDCNIQGAVWVGPSPLDATTMDCNNSQFDEFGSSPGGNADGFSFTVTVPVGECAFFMVDGYAGTTCAGVSAVVPCPAALPVNLVSFTASMIDNVYVNLDWITESEINNDFYTIEKSLNGEFFEVVGIVDGAGNSTTANSYSLADQKPYKGTSYYRLAQTDYDGTTIYSKLAAVTLESSFGGLTVFPNPVKGIGYLIFDSNVGGIAEIVIYNVAGKKIFTEQYNVTKGNNEFELTTVNLPQGMYFLTVSNDKETSNIKFVKY